jgi:hypothetical protein
MAIRVRPLRPQRRQCAYQSLDEQVLGGGDGLRLHADPVA